MHRPERWADRAVSIGAAWRWTAVLAGLLLASCAPVDPTPVAPAGSAKPNIVVIIADDLGYADVSAYHAGRIPTPNIDRLGREGVTFTQGYVTAPICSPSRAGLMTGRHQQRFGFEYNNGPAARDIGERLGLDPRERTLADLLRAAGYRTGAIGKWHLGSSDEHYPTNRGFDEFWGFLTGQTNFIRPDAPEAVNGAEVREDASGGGELERPSAVVRPANAIVTGPDRTPVDLADGYLTEQITDRALEFIDRNRDRPFFLYVAHAAPHTPLQTTRKYYDRFPGISSKPARVYAAMVSALDDQVGALLDGLASRGLDRNTIVIFLSDNGCAAYIDGLCSAAPVAGGKLTYLEGGIRVPYLLRWPARIAPGLVHARPVSTLDVVPTALAAAGTALPADRSYDGRDLLPQIASGSARPALFWRTKPIAAVRDGDWKFVRDLDGGEALYNLSSDPREEVNLIAREPRRAAALRADWKRWNDQMAEPGWTGRFTEFDFGGRHFKFTP